MFPSIKSVIGRIEIERVLLDAGRNRPGRIGSIATIRADGRIVITIAIRVFHTIAVRIIGAEPPVGELLVEHHGTNGVSTYMFSSPVSARYP